VDLDQADKHHQQNPRQKGCYRPRYKNGKRLAQSIFGLSTRIVRLDDDKKNLWSTSDDKKRAMVEELEEEKEEMLDTFGNIVSEGNVSYWSIRRPSGNEFKISQEIMRKGVEKRKEELDVGIISAKKQCLENLDEDPKKISEDNNRLDR